MSKRSTEPQSRRHVFVFDSDWEYLNQVYGMDSPSRLGAGAAVRMIVRAKVRQLRELEAQARCQTPEAPAGTSASLDESPKDV